jgi:tRNA acetyltransferase TAN1|tara:strand:- start:883 stop:1368 length:486 start_codon:yes stop_codon:yes gene_type:complete
MELKAINEVSKLLDEFGDSNSNVLKTQFSGIIKIETGLKILELIEKFRDKIENEPWELRYCSRIIPIQKTCQTDLITIKQNVADLIPLIDPNETYKISIERRDSKLIRNEIISNIAKLLTNHVSLERPDWEIIIQIIGNETGVSILPSNSILSVSKLKRLD